MFGTIRQRPDFDTGQRAFALKPDKVAVEYDHRADQAARPVGHDIAPVLPGRRIKRGLGNAEINGIIRIRADQQHIAMI